MQPVHMQNHSLETKLITQYEEIKTKLIEFYRQRAKKHWATQGDRNTSYFHHAVLLSANVVTALLLLKMDMETTYMIQMMLLLNF